MATRGFPRGGDQDHRPASYFFLLVHSQMGPRRRRATATAIITKYVFKEIRICLNTLRRGILQLLFGHPWLAFLIRVDRGKLFHGRTCGWESGQGKGVGVSGCFETAAAWAIIPVVIFIHANTYIPKYPCQVVHGPHQRLGLTARNAGSPGQTIRGLSGLGGTACAVVWDERRFPSF